METTQLKRRVIRDTNRDFEVRSLDSMCSNESTLEQPFWHNLQYLGVGVLFGIILVKGEIVSWFRIQEMFRLESFHMYGVIGSAIVVGALSFALIRKFKLKTRYGEPIVLHPRSFHRGQVFGGLLFGLGWALTGACPGPLFAQIGAGTPVVLVTLLSAIAGTWVYGWVRPRLPH
jgi:uncharacterized membrane protein YedE/YeeE